MQRATQVRRLEYATKHPHPWHTLARRISFSLVILVFGYIVSWIILATFFTKWAPTRGDGYYVYYGRLEPYLSRQIWKLYRPARWLDEKIRPRYWYDKSFTGGVW